MARVLMPLNGKAPSISPSLLPPDLRDTCDHGQTISESSPNFRSPYIPHITEPGNPTVLPESILQGFNFTFLIRHPRLSIPSVYRLSIPPKCHTTGWHGFRPEDTGYAELHRLFDYLRDTQQVGPVIASRHPATENGHQTGNQNGISGVEICLVEADDLLDDPVGTMSAYCTSIGLPFSPSMLK